MPCRCATSTGAPAARHEPGGTPGKRYPGEVRTQRGYSGWVIDDIKKRALHRTRILEGQLRGLEKMIESEDYCLDIITQSLAIQKSLGSLNKLMVENHLKTHVTDMFDEGGDTRDGAIDELVKIYELSRNRS
jgi:DNA-binding FrmR family transcriptional regulator